MFRREVKTEYELWRDDINGVRAPWALRIGEPLFYTAVVAAAILVVVLRG